MWGLQLDKMRREKSGVSGEEYLIQSRRAFIGGAAGTATLGSVAICACECQDRQKLFANMTNIGMSDYEALPQVQQLKSHCLITYQQAMISWRLE